MIKFFRRIRQRLLTEKPPDQTSRASKFSKYLIYAIGEIALVVIGILIALQINNWNEQRKDRINERELYSRILVDLQADENRIDEDIKYYKGDQSMLFDIYQETQGLSRNDSLINYSTIRASQIFDLVIESNYSKYIKEISKDYIREKIDDYFIKEDHVDEAHERLSDYKEIRIKPFLSKHGINNTKELFNNYQLDYYDLRETNIFSDSKLKEQYGTLELDQILFDLGIRTSWTVSALEDLLAANKELQLNLKNELNAQNPIAEK